MVAPSFVIWISPVEADCNILFIPFGPRVVLTTSPIARAPTNEERRADSARSSVAFRDHGIVVESMGSSKGENDVTIRIQFVDALLR
jgi:hypothetical protein